MRGAAGGPGGCPEKLRSHPPPPPAPWHTGVVAGQAQGPALNTDPPRSMR